MKRKEGKGGEWEKKREKRVRRGGEEGKGKGRRKKEKKRTSSRNVIRIKVKQNHVDVTVLHTLSHIFIEICQFRVINSP